MDVEPDKYEDANFESRDGFSTKIWGPLLWHFLHTLSLACPLRPNARERGHYAGFLRALANVLPCKLCRGNFQRSLRESFRPHEHLASRDAFARYVYFLHDTVPNRPRMSVSFEALKATLDSMRGEATCLLRIVPESLAADAPSFGVEGLHGSPERADEEGFGRDVWSVVLWFFLHTISLNYPVEPTPQEQGAYADFLSFLPHVLPCPRARRAFLSHGLALRPEHLRSRHRLARYVYLLHSLLTGGLEPSFEDLRATHEMFRSKCGPSGCTRQNNHVPSRCLLRVVPQPCAEPRFAISPLCRHKVQ